MPSIAIGVISAYGITLQREDDMRHMTRRGAQARVRRELALDDALDRWDAQETARRAASARLGVGLLLAAFVGGMALIALGL